MLSEFERKQLMQEVIDRVLYCQNYAECIKDLNRQFPVNNKIVKDGKIVITNTFNNGRRTI